MNRILWMGFKCIIGAAAVKLAMPYIVDAVGLYDYDALGLRDMTDEELSRAMKEQLDGVVDDGDNEDYAEV